MRRAGEATALASVAGGPSPIERGRGGSSPRAFGSGTRDNRSNPRERRWKADAFGPERASSILGASISGPTVRSCRRPSLSPWIAVWSGVSARAGETACRTGFGIETSVDATAGRPWPITTRGGDVAAEGVEESTGRSGGGRGMRRGPAGDCLQVSEVDCPGASERAVKRAGSERDRGVRF